MRVKITDEEARRVLVVYLVSQCLIHQIDNVSDGVSVKQEFKQGTNRFTKMVDKHLNAIGRNIDEKEADYYNKIVSEFDALADSIILNIA